MDILKPKTGGMPLHSEDFTFLQDAYAKAIQGLAPNNCVLWGCLLSEDTNNNVFEITEGFVFIFGEIYYVPGETVKGNNTGGTSNYKASDYAWPNDQTFLDDFAFELDEDWDTTGNDTFHDSVNKDTYRTRQMRARYQEVSGPGVNDSDYLSIAGPLREEFYIDTVQKFYNRNDDLKKGGVILFAGSMGYTSHRYRSDQNATYGTLNHLYEDMPSSAKQLGLKNDWNAGSPTAQIRLDRDGKAHLSGSILADGSTSSEVFANVGFSVYKPDRTVKLFCNNTDSPPINRRLEISTTGEMRIVNYTETEWILDGLSYWLSTV